MRHRNTPRKKNAAATVRAAAAEIAADLRFFISGKENAAKRPGISAVSTLVPSEAIFIKAPRNEKKINAEQTADKKCLLSSEPAAVPPVCRNESPFLFVFDISKLKLHHTPFKLILSYDEHIFSYRVRTPNAILI